MCNDLLARFIVATESAKVGGVSRRFGAGLMDLEIQS
jgi:hypothetical protein